MCHSVGTTVSDICSPSRHPLFPQVDLSTFNNLAERGWAHINNDAYAKDGVTDPTTQVGTTTITWLDESHSPFRSAHPPDNPYNTPSPRSATQFVPTAAVQAHQMDDANEEEDDASLAGHTISPRNANRWHQALAKKISLLDMAQLGNARYHGGTKGYEPLSMLIVHPLWIHRDQLKFFNSQLQWHYSYSWLCFRELGAS